MQLDLNQLHTALHAAIAAENYALAAQLRDLLNMALGGDVNEHPADWQRLGVLDWLADRAEDLGYKIPTGMHGGLCTEAVEVGGR